MDYDPDYNAHITALMAGAWTNLRVPANNQLTNSGNAVVINPPGDIYQARQDLDGLIDDLRAYHGLSNPTTAQSVAAIKAIIRVLRLIVRWLWGRG